MVCMFILCVVVCVGVVGIQKHKGCSFTGECPRQKTVGAFSVVEEDDLGSEDDLESSRSALSSHGVCNDVGDF